jgi:MFS family permease
MMFLYTRVHSDLGAVPKDVKALFIGLFVYCIAWGVLDPFLAIFFYQVMGNYSLAGLLYGLFFLIGAGLSIPVGDLADKVNRIKFIAFSILAYPLIGLLYFASVFAGAFSLAVIFVARLLHGVGSLLWIMSAGFIREKSPKGETSAMFGLYISVCRFAYVIAPLFSIPIIILLGLSTTSINWLFLVLIPFPIISAILLFRIKDKGMPFPAAINEVVVKDGVVKKELRDLRGMGVAGTFVILLGFFIKAIEAIILFLIPLYVVSLNLDLVHIAIIFSIINIPYLLSFFFAELADSWGKINVISLGFLLTALALTAIAFIPVTSGAFYVACFALGVILALIRPAVNGLITDITPRVNEGEITGLFTTVLKIGGFVSALSLGILSDFFGLTFPFLLFAALLLIMSVVTYSIKRKIVVKI